MFRLDGRYKTGTRSAAGNLKRQLPLLSKRFPELAECHAGTVNIQFAAQLILAKPDFSYRPIKWDVKEPEVFDFVRVLLTFEAIAAVPAWLYVGHRSPHRFDPHIHEFIARHIAVGVQASIIVAIRFRHSPCSLAFSNF